MESSSPRRSPKTLAAKVRPITSNGQKEVLATYASAIEALQGGQFERAHELFSSLSEDAPVEVRERVRVHLQACERNLQRREREFQSSEERYDYAISLVNTGDYEEAREQLEVLAKEKPEADYAHYGLAMLSSMTGQAEQCLEQLGRAIELNAHCRIQARSDPDFRQMNDDPRFTELLYPEVV
jgi:tetratricopeptide (TPR) repeat protein